MICPVQHKLAVSWHCQRCGAFGSGLHEVDRVETQGHVVQHTKSSLLPGELILGSYAWFGAMCLDQAHGGLPE